MDLIDSLYVDANEHELIVQMRLHGGGFASALAVAWQRADNENRKLLRESFSELLLTYRQFL